MRPSARARSPSKHTVGRVVLISASCSRSSPGWASSTSSVTSTATSRPCSRSTRSSDERPEKVYDGNGEPLNILVMGYDTRDCERQRHRREGGGGSDTTILVHLSADRSRAYAVSIPRDSIVDRPECNADIRRRRRRDVERRLRGGWPELCTIEQFETNTDILIDHFVVVDFDGFGDMVDAVGGVPVCVPEDIVDRGAPDLRPCRATRPCSAATRRSTTSGPVRRRADPAERHQPHQAPADLHRRPRARGASPRGP